MSQSVAIDCNKYFQIKILIFYWHKFGWFLIETLNKTRKRKRNNNEQKNKEIAHINKTCLKHWSCKIL